MAAFWRTEELYNKVSGFKDAKTHNRHGAKSQIRSDEEVKCQIMALDLPAALSWAIVSRQDSTVKSAQPHQRELLMVCGRLWPPK